MTTDYDSDDTPEWSEKFEEVKATIRKLQGYIHDDQTPATIKRGLEVLDNFVKIDYHSLLEVKKVNPDWLEEECMATLESYAEELAELEELASKACRKSCGFDISEQEYRASGVQKRYSVLLRNEKYDRNTIAIAAREAHQLHTDLDDLRRVIPSYSHSETAKRTWSLMWEKVCEHYDECAQRLEEHATWTEKEKEESGRYDNAGEERWD
jgi:hypothetical protein